MKKLSIIFLMVLTSCVFSVEKSSETEKIESSTVSEIEAATTYYLIRHAEKDRSNAAEKDPFLTDLGTARAENWAKVFKDIPLEMVYSTNFKRTKATAQPTLTSKNLVLSIYDDKQMYNEKFQKETKGKSVLVVGHSNTTPAFVNAILKNQKYEDIPDNENGTLFIVTIYPNASIDSQVLHIN